MTDANPVVAEFIARRDREQQKAVEKYGAIGLEPGGDPRRDVLDYAINELVGLVRYAEMIEARFAALPRPRVLTPADRGRAEVIHDGIAFARVLLASASRLAYDALALRQHAAREGFLIGAPEQR